MLFILFGTIYGFYGTISTNFYFYLLYFQQNKQIPNKYLIYLLLHLTPLFLYKIKVSSHDSWSYTFGTTGSLLGQFPSLAPRPQLCLFSKKEEGEAIYILVVACSLSIKIWLFANRQTSSLLGLPSAWPRILYWLVPKK